jgi:hypothetical protein
MWRQLRVAVAALVLPAGCGGNALEPNVDCSQAVGQVFIALQPEPAGLGYQVSAGDSIHVTGTIHRATRAEPVFRLHQGWTCNVTSTSPVAGTVSFTTDDTHLIAIRTGGWIRGLGRGLAVVTASSQEAVSPLTFGVFVN